MSFDLDNLLVYVRSHPQAQNKYKNIYHATTILALFRRLLEEEKVGEDMQREVNAAVVAIHFLAFDDPTDAYMEYCLAEKELPDLTHTYYTVLAGRPKVNKAADNIVALCLIDALILKDMVENDPVHIFENYRVEELVVRRRDKTKPIPTNPPTIERTVTLIKDRLDNVKIHTEAGKRIYSESKDHFIENLNYYATLQRK